VVAQQDDPVEVAPVLPDIRDATWASVEQGF
jgi:hypothetical protein